MAKKKEVDVEKENEEVIEEIPEEDGVIEEVEDEEEPDPEIKATEDRARRMGWRPKEEFNGEPSRWVDAQSFVDRSERELPVLRERFRKLDDRLAGTENKLTKTEERLTESTQVLKELATLSKAAEERGYNKALSELTIRERKAVAEANVDEYDTVQAERQQLEKTRPTKKEKEEPTKADGPPPPNPVVGQWLNNNPWYQQDQVLHAYARQMDSDIEREFSWWPLEDKLSEVKKRTMSKFPEKFGRSDERTGRERNEAPAKVARSSPPPAKDKNKRSVKDLPRDAQEAFARFKRQIPGFTEQQYLDLYPPD